MTEPRDDLLLPNLKNDIDYKLIESCVEQILLALGENPQRQGLKYTPKRVARSYAELLSGYRTDPQKLINNALFDVTYDEMIIVRDIEFASMCEHHMLPFTGKAHVAYLPGKKVIGLSKIPRIVDMYAKRLQIQEQMTRQIAEFIDAVLQPKGVAIVVEARHLCANIRGVKKHAASMTTSTMLGAFKTDSQLRLEFLENLNRRVELS